MEHKTTDTWVRWEDSKWHILSPKVRINPNPGAFSREMHYTVCGDRVFLDYHREELSEPPNDEFDTCLHCLRWREMRDRNE